MKMADCDKNSNLNTENSDKGHEMENKSNIQHDEDTESVEEQPLDIGEHYLVRRSDESWRKRHNITLFSIVVAFFKFVSDPAEIIQTRYNDNDQQYEYYVHYEGYNRRLDEWVSCCKILCKRESCL